MRNNFEKSAAFFKNNLMQGTEPDALPSLQCRNVPEPCRNPKMVPQKNEHMKTQRILIRSLSTLQSPPSQSQMPHQNPEYYESGGPKKHATAL